MKINNFRTPEGDVENQAFITEEWLVDQWIGDKLRVWGSNEYNQLGIESIEGSARSTPVTTFAGGNNWKQVSSAVSHTAAIKTDGTLWVWGSRIHFYIPSTYLGVNDNNPRSTPVTTFAGGTNWKQVSCGSNATAAIKTDGTLWVWGSDSLGTNSNVNKSTPVTTFAGGNDWKQVSCSNGNMAAIKTDGTLWVWGTNSDGQLGTNDVVTKSTPVTTFAGGNNWKQVSSAGSHTAAIKTDGTLWTWGFNYYGQLGINTQTARSTPVTTLFGGNNWKQVSAGAYNMAAIKTDGTLWCWGRNNVGQLGTNNTIDRSTPVTTFAGGNDWKQVSCSLTNYIAAIKTGGTLWCWGRNNVGQLGTNNTIDRSTPVTTFAGGNDWKQVDTGFDMTCAITSGTSTEIAYTAPPPEQTFTITASSTSIDEGNSVTFTVTSTNFGNGTLNWSTQFVSGTITGAELSPSNGTVTLTNDVGYITVSTPIDYLTDGNDSFRITLISPTGQTLATSPIVTINDTSLTPSFTITPNTTTVEEGYGVSFTIQSTNFINQSASWAVQSMGGTFTSADVTPSSGNIFFSSSTMLLNISVVSDATIESDEYFRIILTAPNGSSYTSSTITIPSQVAGQIQYTTAGTYSWTCPAGVTSVCVVCIGGGGGGDNGYGTSSGAGGGLGWKNNIPVIPGTMYTVVVGSGGNGAGQNYSPGYGTVGTDSYFINTSVVKGGGGGKGTSGGNYVGGGGGNGGSGVAANSGNGGGGGGAGGYYGNGGGGGYAGNGGAGSGGGGGGGAKGVYGSSSGLEYRAGAGGGTGIYGAGANGAGGLDQGSTARNGKGGSGGQDGQNQYIGGQYGGGGPLGPRVNLGSVIGRGGGNGAGGAVRIIWGPGRSFPSNAQ